MLYAYHPSWPSLADHGPEYRKSPPDRIAYHSEGLFGSLRQGRVRPPRFCGRSYGMYSRAGQPVSTGPRSHHSYYLANSIDVVPARRRPTSLCTKPITREIFKRRSSSRMYSVTETWRSLSSESVGSSWRSVTTLATVRVWPVALYRRATKVLCWHRSPSWISS